LAGAFFGAALRVEAAFFGAALCLSAALCAGLRFGSDLADRKLPHQRSFVNLL